jgi:acetolactate synthase small subunit
MGRAVSAKAQIRSTNHERVTLVVEAQSHENVLLPVVALFDELKVKIDAIWMVRHKRTGNPHISITVETEPASRGKIEDYLSKIVGILSVKTESGSGRTQNLELSGR